MDKIFPSFTVMSEIFWTTRPFVWYFFPEEPMQCWWFICSLGTWTSEVQKTGKIDWLIVGVFLKESYMDNLVSVIRILAEFQVYFDNNPDIKETVAICSLRANNIFDLYACNCDLSILKTKKLKCYPKLQFKFIFSNWWICENFQTHC